MAEIVDMCWNLRYYKIHATGVQWLISTLFNFDIRRERECADISKWILKSEIKQNKCIITMILEQVSLEQMDL